jgi:glycerol-3-phosphate dehydrogenase
MNVDCDVAVVGAGINGAGVAQAAAAGGWSVCVLEQSAIAAGTSSRSSKLIHGGLRYLETGNFRLVRESLRERSILLRLAPELVHRVAFHIPLYRTTVRQPLTVRLGLSLYALLAGLGADARFASVPRHQWHRLDGLTTESLRAVYRYFDAQTDDAKLTHAVMRSAQSMGAQLLCPARFVGARRIGDGAEVDYIGAHGAATLRARVLINAAGAWANQVCAAVAAPPPTRPISLVQGTHVVLPGRLAHGAYYLEAPSDRRAVFVLPWQDAVLVGTTETEYRGDPAHVTPLPHEIDYLRATAAHYFPALHAAPRAAFAGLRVLPQSSATPFERSRETMLHVDDNARPRVLTIYGGKLTSYRLTAQRALACVAHALPRRRVRGDTARLPLPPDQ